MERHRDRREDHGEDDQRVAPSMRVGERLRQREEDEARQRGDQRHRGHRPPALRRRREVLRQHGERGLVQHRGHHEAEHGPQRIERREPLHARPREHQQRAGDRSTRHEAPRAVPIEVAPDRDARDARDSETERERPGELGRGVAQLVPHRHQEDREGVVEDPPRHRLRDRERPDDPPRSRAPGGARTQGGAGAHAPIEMSSSGAPLPQHAEPPFASAAAGGPLHTPVSGSTSSTRRAACQSPASAAATERTCS
jgi:hypothetical protein